MKKISAVLITYNEEKNVRQALESLTWVDEIVVVDSFSADKTVEICRSFTEKIFQRPWSGYVAQKNYACEQAAHDWILSLDADERVSEELRKELEAWRQRDQDAPCGFLIPRKTFFLGRWIQHTNWYPDYQLRLFDRRYGRWEGGRVSESVKVSGPVGRFDNALLHHSFENLSDWLARADRYSTLAAQDMLQRGEQVTLWGLVLHPFGTFIKSYLFKQGFRDGVPGLIVSCLSAIFVFLKYAKLWEKHRET